MDTTYRYDRWYKKKPIKTSYMFLNVLMVEINSNNLRSQKVSMYHN